MKYLKSILARRVVWKHKRPLMRGTLHQIALMTLVLSSLSNCGKPSQKVQQKTSNGSDAAGESSPATPSKEINQAQIQELKKLSDPSCTSTSRCNDVPFQIVDDSQKKITALQGGLSKPVSWDILLDAQAKDGRLLVGVKSLPTWASSTAGEMPGSKKITGTPNQKTSGANIQLVVRDMLRCKLAVGETKLVQCFDPDASFQFDKKVSIKYVIN